MSVNRVSPPRREDFEALLNQYQAEVDAMQELEVPRSVEEIKKVVSQLQTLDANLEAAKEVMTVHGGLIP